MSETRSSIVLLINWRRSNSDGDEVLVAPACRPPRAVKHSQKSEDRGKKVRIPEKESRKPADRNFVCLCTLSL
jgi:hypothetical protein